MAKQLEQIETAEQEAARVAAEHADISAQVRRYGRRTVYLTARHVSPSYCFQAEPVTVSATVSSDRNGLPVVRYYADHAKLGCGKDAKSPADAVLSLARDHACNWIEVRDADGNHVSHIPPMTPRQEAAAMRLEAEQLKERAEQLEQEAAAIVADNVRRPASLGAMANPFHAEPVRAARSIRRPALRLVSDNPNPAARPTAAQFFAASDAWLLASRCMVACPGMDRARMNVLAGRAAAAIKRNSPAARLWLGQMRAHFRRAMVARAA